MGVFRVFKIAQMVPNPATHHICDLPIPYSTIICNKQNSQKEGRQSYEIVQKATQGKDKIIISTLFVLHGIRTCMNLSSDMCSLTLYSI